MRVSQHPVLYHHLSYSVAIRREKMVLVQNTPKHHIIDTSRNWNLVAAKKDRDLCSYHRFSRILYLSIFFQCYMGVS